jgi:superfamily II DNA or RNA helicase
MFFHAMGGRTGTIDTAIKRDLADLSFDLCIVDECHDATSNAYRLFLNNLNCKYFVGFTATPYRVGKRGHSFWEAVSSAIGMPGLVEQGYLTDSKLFGPPLKADLGAVSVTAGEYNQKELGTEMSRLHVIADVIETYQKLGQNKPAICFCVNKEHALILTDKFNRAGISSAYADCDSTKEERDHAIHLLESGQVKVLCNVNIWSTGVDVPCLEVCILARPTKSVNLYLQQVGRAFRPFRICGNKNCGKVYDNSNSCYHCGYPSPKYIKHHAIVLDHGENIKRHGQPHIFRKAELTDKAQGEFKRDAPIFKTCGNCSFIIENMFAQICPSCFMDLQPSGSGLKKVSEKDGELIEYKKEEVKKLSQDEIHERFKLLLAKKRTLGP